MPTSKSATARRVATPAVQEVPELQCAADAMFRAAEECCQQQGRLSRVLELACGEKELEAVIAVSVLCAKVLDESVTRYTSLSASSHEGLLEECWHAANSLWHASREYARRHQSCNVKSALRSRHTATQLGELAVEYELKASAVLALRYAVEEYARKRPQAR